jgi:hypothetical protein
MSESDGKLLNAHIRPLGRKKVAQLVPENHETESEYE